MLAFCWVADADPPCRRILVSRQRTSLTSQRLSREIWLGPSCHIALYFIYIEASVHGPSVPTLSHQSLSLTPPLQPLSFRRITSLILSSLLHGTNTPQQTISLRS